MYNLIQFVKKYHFILLFLLIEGFSIFLLVNNNQYQGNKIGGFSQHYVGNFHAGVANISEWFKLKKSNDFLAKENAKLLSLLKKQNNYTTDSASYNDPLFKYQSAVVINNAFGMVSDISNIAPHILWNGLKTSLVTTFSGGFILLISTILWYLFSKKYRAHTS